MDDQQQQQQPPQTAKAEKREAKKKKRARRSSAFKRLMVVVIAVVVLLAISHLMNNFDDVVGRDVITVNEKYIHDGGKGYAIVDADGYYYWLSKEDWDSCEVGEEIKLYTNRDGSSFIEKEGNLLREIFN